MNILDMDSKQKFESGDLVLNPATGLIGTLVEREILTEGWIVNWFIDKKGKLIGAQLQTCEYHHSVLLYAKASEA
jgi:hypothetical protein